MKLEIPKPCPEKFSEMKPVDGGAFCSVCNKKVVDFTRSSPSEIDLYFENKNPEAKVCALIKKEQILEMNFDAFFSRFSFWNIWRKAAVIVYFIFGMGLFSCSGSGDEVAGEMEPMGKVQVIDSIKTLNNTNEVDMGKVQAVDSSEKKKEVPDATKNQ